MFYVFTLYPGMVSHSNMHRQLNSDNHRRSSRENELSLPLNFPWMASNNKDIEVSHRQILDAIVNCWTSSWKKHLIIMTITHSDWIGMNIQWNSSGWPIKSHKMSGMCAIRDSSAQWLRVVQNECRRYRRDETRVPFVSRDVDISHPHALHGLYSPLSPVVVVLLVDQ